LAPAARSYRRSVPWRAGRRSRPRPSCRGRSQDSGANCYAGSRHQSQADLYTNAAARLYPFHKYVGPSQTGEQLLRFLRWRLSVPPLCDEARRLLSTVSAPPSAEQDRAQRAQPEPPESNAAMMLIQKTSAPRARRKFG
jgi:hypothetical protein